MNHLWQSTVFAAVAGLLTLALRQNRARVRYLLWFAASVKFLIPLSVLIALGSQMEWKTPPVQRTVAIAVEQVVEPFTVSVVSTPAPVEDHTPDVLFILWTAGVLVISATWLLRWRRIRNTVRTGSTIEMDLPLRVVCSPTTLEPGVFGIFRPVLVLPEGIFERLTPTQLKAILAHELCHVRHRDNLLAAIHMFVETIFWFHPLVWWIGKRMVAEREQACDEEVLRELGEPQAYAEGILNVCKLYVESPLRCVSGITGADLKKRIEAIMTNRVRLRLNFGRKAVLAGAGLVAVAIPLIVGAQETANRPQFEVASIRPCDPDGGGGRGGPTPGRLYMVCGTVEMGIRLAYGDLAQWFNANSLDPIEGLPAWAKSERYTINAKAPDGTAPSTIHGPMLQTLLEDRFKLKLHRENRDGSVYELSVAKGGFKLRPRNPDTCVAPAGQKVVNPCDGAKLNLGPVSRVEFFGTSTSSFAKDLRNIVERPVIDKTGLAGIFDFPLQYSPEPPAGRSSDAYTGPSIFTAMEEQLGLKLDSARGPHEILVVDSVERPSEN